MTHDRILPLPSLLPSRARAGAKRFFKTFPIFVLLLLVAALGAIGCGSAVSSGQNTALSGGDLVKITDDMAARLASDPGVREAVQREGALRVVVEPVENRLTAEVLPKGPADAFTARVRDLLSRESPKDFMWIMNRDAFYSLRNSELEAGVDLGPAPGAINPQYALTAIFSSLTNENRDRRTAYYLCTYELTDLRDRTVLWTRAYEMKKTIVKGFLD
jgi:ABC-type glycerol-3-phosphate transport system substrate-binding protein